MAECLNGGSCLFDEGKDTFSCSCSPQWRGERCEMGKSKLFLFLKYGRQYRRRVKDVTRLKTKSYNFLYFIRGNFFRSKERVVIKSAGSFSLARQLI